MSKPNRDKNRVKGVVHYPPLSTPVQLPIKGPKQLKQILKGWNLIVESYDMTRTNQTIKMTFTASGIAPVRHYVASKKGYANYATPRGQAWGPGVIGQY